MYRVVSSPVGPLTLGADDAGLRMVEFTQSSHAVARGPDWRLGEHPLLDRAEAQLVEYFNGRRREFDVSLAPLGTVFQSAVWSGLRQIPFGRTWSYAQLAAHIGRPKAVRAVGAANGRNPIAIIVPCHRVIGANGSLVGFGGGLQAKEFLLRLEQR